jgi:serine/threonine protein kinase
LYVRSRIQRLGQGIGVNVSEDDSVEWTGRGRFPQPGESFARYRIDRRLGHGAMGVVYAATQVDLGRTVALKVLSPALAEAEEYRHRFAREAAVLARVDSPHIVQIFEAGSVEDWQYLVMQYVPGGDLRQLIDAGPIPLPEGLKIVGDAASGVQDAHAVGVLHRDVKPSNILLRTSSRRNPHAYVADLGIAQTVGEDVTRTRGHRIPGLHAARASSRRRRHCAG